MISNEKRIEVPAPTPEQKKPASPKKSPTVAQVSKAAKTDKATAKTLIKSVANLKKGKVGAPVNLKKALVKGGTPRIDPKAHAKKPPVLKRDLEAKKKPSEQKNPKLNVAEIISLIRNGKTATAVSTLKEYQCTSPEGCGFVIFHDGMCFNHYHVKMKYGRDKRINTRHNGELCSVCKKRPATNRDKCLPCYARLKYHEDKAKGIVRGKKIAKKKEAPKPQSKAPVLSTKHKLLKAGLKLKRVSPKGK